MNRYEGMMMNEQEVIQRLKALGLAIGSDGVVTDEGGRGYCQATAGALRVPDPDNAGGRVTVPFREITSISYSGSDCMTLQTPQRPEREIPVTGNTALSAEEGLISYEMPMTISALRDVLPVVYPGLDSMVYYDELAEKEMVDMALFDRKAGVVPLTDSIMSVYHDDLERRLDDYGFSGKRFPSMQTRDEALAVVMHDNRRNLFREWVESLEWDGVPRLRKVLRTLFGATAPALWDDEDKDGSAEAEARYLGDVAEAWLIGAIRRMYTETKHEIVPVFIGAQGIGKGTALKFLAGKDHWYKDTTVDFKDPQRFLDSVRGAIIVELGESVQLQGDDQGLLKAFISQSSDHMRKAYAHYDEFFPRHFILAASSNNEIVFRDPTGARRFFPVVCDPDIQQEEGFTIPTNSRPRRHQAYIEQVWAEALHMYNEGRKWYLTDRRTLNDAYTMQLWCSVERIGTDAISEWLDDPQNGYSDVGARASRLDILRSMYGVDAQHLGREEQRMWNQWAEVHPGWMYRTAKVKGISTKIYERIRAPGEAVERKTFAMASGDELEVREDLEDDDGPAGRFYRYLMAHPGAIGDTFHDEDLTEEEIEEFLEEGYIYDNGSPETGRQLCIGVEESDL